MELPNFLTESAFLRDQALASREAARAKQRRSKDSNTADAPFACLQGLANQKLNRLACFETLGRGAGCT